MISKLQLKSFYESHKDEYYSRRNSGDNAHWDEGYKWEIFPKLNEVLAEYTTLTADNLPDKEVLKSFFYFWRKIAAKLWNNNRHEGCKPN